MHQHPVYKKIRNKFQKYSNSKKHYETSISLPIYYNLKIKEQNKIINLLKIFLEKINLLVKYLIILQARVNSQRLHGKVLKKIRDIPLVILCAKRLKNTRKPLIVAIPKDKSNLCLKRLIKKNKINYSVGPNKNVFSRFKKIISKNNAETIIIRATADNPLPNGKFVDEMLEIFQKHKLDYLDTTQKILIYPMA